MKNSPSGTQCVSRRGPVPICRSARRKICCPHRTAAGSPAEARRWIYRAVCRRISACRGNRTCSRIRARNCFIHDSERCFHCPLLLLSLRNTRRASDLAREGTSFLSLASFVRIAKRDTLTLSPCEMLRVTENSRAASRRE